MCNDNEAVLMWNVFQVCSLCFDKQIQRQIEKKRQKEEKLQ